MQTREELLLRVLLESPDKEGVAALIPAIEAGVSGLARVVSWSGERYWKFPELFDCTLKLEPVTSAAIAFTGIVGLASHWQLYDDDESTDREAIWGRNVNSDGVFIHPRIEWVQLMLNRLPIAPEPQV